MAQAADRIDVYLEVGAKRTFAGALEWPGWCRSGRDESSALQALLEYGPRYRRALQPARLGFRAPSDVSAFVVVERLKGDSTTDFGAPGKAPSADSDPIRSDDLRRFEKILRACWRAFDASVEAARGKALRTGPRGGGRVLEAMIQHLMGGDAGYLTAVGWKLEREQRARLEPIREAILQALQASAAGEIPTRGPRGGLRWTGRYFVRRVAWHTLDHAWELEDRLQPE